MSLLADPSRFDSGGPGAQVRPSWQVGKIVFLLSRHPMFANEPGSIAWKVLLTLVPYPLRRSIGCTHPDGGKAGFQSTLRPVSPAHRLPVGIGKDVFGRHR
jgi:hypothetical protein